MAKEKTKEMEVQIVPCPNCSDELGGTVIVGAGCPRCHVCGWSGCAG